LLLKYSSFHQFISNVKVPIPVTVLHVVNLVGRPLDCTWYPRVSPCPTGKVFEVWSGFVLVALKTIIQAPVRFVVRLGGDVAEEADFEALLLGVEDVELPDGDAGGGEPEGHQAVVHQGGRDGPEEPAHARVVREILTDVDTKILETGACTTVSSVGHREPVRLALLLAGEVGQLVEQVVRRRVSLLGPLH